VEQSLSGKERGQDRRTSQMNNLILRVSPNNIRRFIESCQKSFFRSFPDCHFIIVPDDKHRPLFAEKMAENHLIFVDAEKSQENYAIPSAFAAYAKYMGIRLGNEKFLETD